MTTPSRRRNRRLRPALVPLVLPFAVSLALPGCGADRVHLRRELDENEWMQDEFESATPSSYADRWGEPDVWRDETVRGELQSTMIWNCLEGEYREMVWQLADLAGGRRYWIVVKDVTREGDCPE